MIDSSQDLRELILQLVPDDGSSIGNQALITELREILPEIDDAEYHNAKDTLVAQGILTKGRGRGGSVKRAVGTEFRPRNANPANPVRILDVEYIALNTALNDYFFDGRFEMLPIYLELEGNAETEIAHKLELEPGELEDFIGLCAAQSLRFDKTDPYSDHISGLKAWSEAGRREPMPFTALLTALSIAAERMGADQKFSPNNYYERLFELLGVGNATDQQKLKQYAKSTRQFWRALNLWLSEKDFLLGRPTAKALVSHWQYASYALSQALVREADRKRFSGLFETYHLEPGDTLPSAEMSLFVHDWMTKQGPSGPSSWLRKLWSAQDLRERVIAAALDAFEAWDRPTSVSTDIGPRKARLHWELAFSSFPIKRARLLLTVSRGGIEEPIIVDNPKSQPEPKLFLEAAVEAGRQVLGPIESMNLDLMLLRSRTFKGALSGTSYTYVAKPIVAFARSLDAATYIEVPRVSLFDEHAILCHDAWLARVEGHLAKCARPGYSVLRPTDTRGLPEGWCILRGVEIVRSIEDTNDNLFVLNPIGGTAAVGCVEGLKLGYGTWHADARPSVEATSDEASSYLEIARERFGEPDEVLAKSSAAGGFMEASLDQIKFVGSIDLRAVVKTGNAELAETSISFRSADVPRPLGTKRIYHSVELGRGFLLEGLHQGDGIGIGLEGCVVHGNVKPLAVELSRGIDGGTVEVPTGHVEEQPERDWYRSPEIAKNAHESCVIRGYHHWVYEPFQKGDDRFEPKMGECQSCHVRALSRSRVVARGNARRTNAVSSSVPLRARARATHLSDDNTSGSGQQLPALDTVFDALCYLGEGSWGAFQRLASRASPEPWFTQSFANDLFVLGHVEMNDPVHGLPTSWSVPPPVLVVGLDQQAYLTGFHARSLVSRLDQVLASAGARHEPIVARGQITLHKWSSLSDLDLETLLRDVVDPHGRGISIARGLGTLIASNLPSLEVVWQRAMPVHIERADGISRFRAKEAKWSSVDVLDRPGAYRVGLHGTRYVYRDTEGNTRQVGHRVAKILAARAEGALLHGYDNTSGRFTAALGADPPGLFARALVASGGALPAIEGGRLVYKNVDPAVAAMVISKLYWGDKSIG
jgi:hypothetical protein